MSATQYVHAKSDQTDWEFVRENLLLGNAFDSVWCRQLIPEVPNVWQVKLTSGQELPSHSFGSGDLRWGAKNFDYGPEVMGSTGFRMIVIQKDEPLGVNWSDT